MVRSRYFRRVRRFPRRRPYRKRRRISRLAFAKGKARYPRRYRRMFKAIALSQEKKDVTSVHAFRLDNNGRILEVTLPEDKGTNANQRIGDKIFLRYITIRGVFTMPMGLQLPNSEITSLLRTCIIWPKEMAYLTPANMAKGYNVFWDNSKFTVLSDRIRPLGRGQYIPYNQLITSTPENAVFQYLPNANAPAKFPFKYTMKVFKTISFTSDVPTDTIPSVYMFVDTNPLYDTALKPLIQYTAKVTYTDA